MRNSQAERLDHLLVFILLAGCSQLFFINCEAEEFSSFLTFLGMCENSEGVLHTSVYNCTSASQALSEWGKILVITMKKSIFACVFALLRAQYKEILISVSFIYFNLKLRKKRCSCV